MQIENIKITELKRYDKNARKHPARQIDLLAQNIQEFGFTTPLLVDADNNVIAGHGRLLALEKLQHIEAPCVRMSDLTKQQVKALRLADNQLASMSDWEMDLVIEELEELEPYLFDLTGFDADLLLEPEEKDDGVPDTPETPRSKLGDLYQLGPHRVLCGDSTKLEDVERLMDGKKADMVFTDPPYGIDLDTDYTKMQNGFRATNKFSAVANDDKQFDYSQFSYLDTEEQFWWGANYYIDTLPEYGKSGSWLVWDKRGQESMDKMFGSGFELCWSKKPHQQKIIRAVFAGAFGHNRAEDGATKLHPTQKSIKLCSIMINEYSEADQLLLDLFLGSGSTLIASEKTGRICYGMELDPKYVDVAVQRYVDYVDDPVVLLNGERVDWPKLDTK